MNPDHALLLDFVRRGAGGEGHQPVAVDTNLLAHELGCTLIDADPAADTLTLGFEPDARFVQGNRVVQGGIVTAMLDFAGRAVHARHQRRPLLGPRPGAPARHDAGLGQRRPVTRWRRRASRQCDGDSARVRRAPAFTLRVRPDFDTPC